MVQVNDMEKKPEIIKAQTIARSRLFHIEQLDLKFSNGVEVQYERLCSAGQGAVMIVPMLDDDTVLLIREYAAGVERYELALPKGRIEPGEDVLEAANREIMEEVGYAAHALHHLDVLTLAPGYLSHTTHLVLAKDLYPQRREGDEPEAIEVVPWRLSELNALLARDDFTEARTIAALFMVRERMHA